MYATYCACVSAIMHCVSSTYATGLFVWLFGCLVVWLFGCLVVCDYVFNVSVATVRYH